MTIIRLLRPVIHSILILAIFYSVYQLRQFTDLIPGIQLKIPTMVLEETILYAIISTIWFIAIGIIKNLYELHKPLYRHFTKLSKTRLYRTVSITFLAYFGQGFLFIWWISRFIIITAVIGTIFALMIFDSIRNSIDKKIYKHRKHKMLIIANNQEDAKKVIPLLHGYYAAKYDIIETQKRDRIQQQKKYHTTIMVGTFQRNFLQDVFEQHRLQNTRLFHLTESFLLEDAVYKPDTIGNAVVLEYTHSKLDWRTAVFKRLFDFFWATLGLILLSPLLLIIAIAIKVDSSWPVFYVQKRVGKHGKLFNFVKFRSMYTHLSVGQKYWWKKAEQIYQDLIHSDQNIRQWELPKIHNDPRVTKVGRFIRKTSLDELPNLFSIIRWDMSIVGPRPHMPNEIENYKSRQKRLLSTKPWMTGYAQVFGRDTLSFDQEARLDLYYIQNRSVRLDIYVIFMTIKVLFKGR